MSYQPIILIGSARSGTKILRDTIATHPDVNKIGFDINFIWKRFNEDIEHDKLEPSLASKKVINYIRRYFKKSVQDKPILIEKTVSNTLRIPFVHKVFPDAKFIFLYRDGRDAVESVMRQWGQAPSSNYLIKKFLSVPFIDVTPYLFSYLIDLVRIKLKLKTTNDYVWGVKHPNYEKDLKNKSLLEFCAIQWNHCIQTMLTEQNTNSINMITIKYEDFINQPRVELKKVGKFIGLSSEAFDTTNIRKGSVGTAQRNLSKDDFVLLEQLTTAHLKTLGYLKPSK